MNENIMRTTISTYSKPRLLATLRAGVAGIVCLGAIGLTSSCSDSTDAVDADGSQLQLLPFVSAMADVTRSVTVPSGYDRYSTLYPHPDARYATIGVFMTPEKASAMGSFVYEGVVDDVDKWASNVYVTSGTHYYLYGFMPREMAADASITAYNSDYENGAVLTIDDIQLITPADPCLVVGVQDVGTEDTNGTITPTDDGEVKLGTFSYTGKQRGANFVRLLLDHLYAGIHFKLLVNEGYSELRSIHLRKFEFKCTAYSTADCKVTVQANSTGNNPITDITYSNLVSGPISAEIFDGDALIPTSPADPLDVLGCFAPTLADVSDNLSIVTTFDVYDKEGNLVREGATAENHLPISISHLTRGQVYTLTITVNPTYLYQLSDPDLDNPTIKISNP